MRWGCKTTLKSPIETRAMRRTGTNLLEVSVVFETVQRVFYIVFDINRFFHWMLTFICFPDLLGQVKKMRCSFVPAHITLWGHLSCLLFVIRKDGTNKTKRHYFQHQLFYNSAFQGLLFIKQWISYWAQWFESQLVVNPGLNLTRVSFSFI